MTTTDVVVASDPGALEADPVGYMATVLNRAKGWLAEAQSIESVRETKAIMVGYESVIREKELAFDAQLSATEIVRRCERRIGELVKEGQQNGVIYTPQTTRIDPSVGGSISTVSNAMGSASKKAIDQTYTMRDASDEEFEAAIIEAREEGNLSRANIVRKVKGEAPLASERSEWHHKKRHIDSNRILSTLAQELDAATSGLDLIDIEALDPDVLAESVESIKRSLSTINRHVRRITQ